MCVCVCVKCLIYTVLYIFTLCHYVYVLCATLSLCHIQDLHVVMSIQSVSFHNSCLYSDSVVFTLCLCIYLRI